MATNIPSAMQAAQFSSAKGGIDKNIQLNTSAPLPKKAGSLAKDCTLVKVVYASLNPADYKFYELPIGFLFPKPVITGMDYSGTVVKTTRTDLQVGQRVFGRAEPFTSGTLAEYIVVGREGCVPLPKGVQFDQASGIGTAGLTAYQCIEAYVKPGNRVLIIGGSGGTGTFGIQISKALGCQVTAICSGANSELCRSLGADKVIDYRTENVLEVLKASAKSGNELYDVIVDNVGSDLSIYYASQEFSTPKCQYNIVGGDLSLPFAWEIVKMLALPSWLGGGQRPAKFVAASTNANQNARIAAWMAEGKVRTVVEDSFPLEDTARAFSKLRIGRTRGKILVRVGDE